MPAFLAAILTDLGRTVIAGFVLAVIMFLLYWVTQGYSGADFGPFFFRWLHVLSGVMWIGLLWYFNFVQIPNMAKIPDEQKPAIDAPLLLRRPEALLVMPLPTWQPRWGPLSRPAKGGPGHRS